MGHKMRDIVTVLKEEYYAKQQDFDQHVTRVLEGSYTRFDESDEEIEYGTAEARGEFGGGLVITAEIVHRTTIKQKLWSRWHNLTKMIRRLGDHIRR